MSMPETCSTFPWMSRTFRTDIPMGLGLMGEQMLKTPIFLLRCGGVWLRYCEVNCGLL